MKSSDLERLLVGAGAAASKVATITGRLRDAEWLPKAGRGPYAPQITADQAAATLAAVAGSSQSKNAGNRIEKLAELTRDGMPSGTSFLGALAELLSDEDLAKEVQEVRVARTIGRATIIYLDGKSDEFLGEVFHDLDRRFRSVGELPGGLLVDVAKMLKFSGGPKKRRRRPHPEW